MPLDCLWLRLDIVCAASRKLPETIEFQSTYSRQHSHWTIPLPHLANMDTFSICGYSQCGSDFVPMIVCRFDVEPFPSPPSPVLPTVVPTIFVSCDLWRSNKKKTEDRENQGDISDHCQVWLHRKCDGGIANAQNSALPGVELGSDAI